MDYKGFDIIKKRKDLYWVIYNGSMLGSAKNMAVQMNYTVCMVISPMVKIITK